MAVSNLKPKQGGTDFSHHVTSSTCTSENVMLIRQCYAFANNFTFCSRSVRTSSFKAGCWVDSCDSCSKPTLNHSDSQSLFPPNCKNASMRFFQWVDRLTWFCSGKTRCATVDNKQPHWLDLTFAPWTLSAVTLFLSVESVFPQTRFEDNPALFTCQFSFTTPL